MRGGGGWIALAAIGGTLAATPQPSAASEWITRRLALMGTTLDLTIEAESRAQALAASERAVRAIEAAERRLSTWRPDSELSGLDRSTVGVPVPLSPALAADLLAALDCARETGGAFDPTVGPLVEAWGLRHGGRRPDETELAAARRVVGFAGLSLAKDAAGRPTATFERAGLSIEEGGFGKGAGLGDALAVLAAEGVASAQLDFGGQLAIFGGRPVWIALADPDRRQRKVLEVSIDSGSLSTSGNSERWIEIDGERLGHLLDPRTGRPATDFGSLTVWAADPLRADCLSTGLYILGPEGALAWAAAHPGVEVLVLVRDRTAKGEPGPVRALASAGWRGRVRRLAPDLAIEWPPIEGNKEGREAQTSETTGGGEPWAGTWSPSPPQPGARP